MLNLRFAGLVVATALSIIVPTSATAQESTPVANPDALMPYAFVGPFAPPPDLCTATPISTDFAASLLATPTAVVQPTLTAHGTIVLPAGTPADVDATAAVVELMTQLWACNNARNLGAALGLFTDEAVQATFGSTEASQWDLAALRADVAAALTPGEPRSDEELASIDGIASVVRHEDDRIGVLVLNTDPLVANGRPVLDYFAFELQDDGYKLDEIVLDPFDLTADYGFDGAT